jgi:hypothetical protein
VSASAFLLEVFIFGVSWEQFGMARIVYNIAKYSSARIPAKITGSLMRKFPRASQNKFYEGLIDCIALSVHQIPIYAVSATIFGIDSKRIFIFCLIYFIENFLFGWVYGILLKWTEEKFIKKTA